MVTFNSPVQMQTFFSSCAGCRHGPARNIKPIRWLHGGQLERKQSKYWIYKLQLVLNITWIWSLLHHWHTVTTKASQESCSHIIVLLEIIYPWKNSKLFVFESMWNRWITFAWLWYSFLLTSFGIYWFRMITLKYIGVNKGRDKSHGWKSW